MHFELYYPYLALLYICFFFFIGFGLKMPLGHVDFYPNGGIDQPGCPTTYFAQLGMMLKGNFGEMFVYYRTEEPLMVFLPLYSHATFIYSIRFYIQ